MERESLSDSVDAAIPGTGEPDNRETLEDEIFFQGTRPRDAIREYNPVMYKVVHSKEDLNVKDSIIDIQEGFLMRTERLLKQHQKRSHIHDGLKYLSNEEIIHKVTERPTKLKERAKNLLAMLEKHDVRLDENGDVDYSRVEDKNIVKALKPKE